VRSADLESTTDRRLPEIYHSGTGDVSITQRMRGYLLFGRVTGGGRNRGGLWNIDDLSRTSIVQLLARFFLDSLCIGLERTNLLGVEFVFLLLAKNSLLQPLVICALLLVDDHAISPEHDVHKQKARQHRHCNGRYAPSPRVNTRRNRTQLPSECICERLRFRCLLRQGSQSILRRRKSPDSCNSVYSKIHCLATVLHCFILARYTDLASIELPRIGVQLPSELAFHLGGQAKVPPLWIIGTNLVTWRPQRFLQRSHMTDKRIVFTTAGSHEEARKIARNLVEQRLAACVNIIPQISSFYRWQNKVEEATEWLLVIKTTAAAFAQVSEAIAELHSYDLPECVCFAIEDGSPGYLEWIAESVSAGGGE
jgi:periplasmic divalent cation tolerance protein